MHCLVYSVKSGPVLITRDFKEVSACKRQWSFFSFAAAFIDFPKSMGFQGNFSELGIKLYTFSLSSFSPRVCHQPPNGFFLSLESRMGRTTADDVNYITIIWFIGVTHSTYQIRSVFGSFLFSMAWRKRFAATVFICLLPVPSSAAVLWEEESQTECKAGICLEAQVMMTSDITANRKLWFRRLMEHSFNAEILSPLCHLKVNE